LFRYRSVARASHENSKAEAAKKASPISVTGRAARPAARSNPEPQPKAANISRKAGKKPEGSAEDAAVKEPNFEDILPELQADDEESADDDGSGEDEFTSQRLVVRLTQKQEKKLGDGLDKIKAAAKSKVTPSPAAKSGEHLYVVQQKLVIFAELMILIDGWFQIPRKRIPPPVERVLWCMLDAYRTVFSRVK
jgi:hypothetical protein